MPRAYPTRAMKKRESATREEATFQTSFPDLSNGKIFIPQQETGTAYNDISRGTNNHARAMEGENPGGRAFICAEAKTPYDATAFANCELRISANSQQLDALATEF